MTAFAEANKEKREISGIKTIEISKGANVSLIDCDKEEIEVVTEGCPTSDVETTIKDGVLQVRMKKRTAGSAVQVFVYFKDIDAISVKTGASVQTDCLFEHEGELALNVGAKCEAEMDLRVGKLSVEAVSAKIILSGSADDFDVKIGGAVGDSELDALSLQCKTIALEATNTDATVWFTDSLDATAKAGTVKYKGPADKVNANCSFGGQVVAQD